MKWPPLFHRRSLTVQMILSFMALVLLTAVAAGLPAVFLIRNQIEQHAWRQVDQGSRATEALYATWQSRVDDLVTLTAQRPTLHTLLAQGQTAALADYLRTLQGDTELDVLLVCDPSQQVVAMAGTFVTADVCADDNQTAAFYASTTEPARTWLLAVQAVADETAVPGTVVGGVVLDDDFARQMSKQTGLEHTLVVDGRVVASSFTVGATWQAEALRPAVVRGISATNPATLQLEGRPYYTARIPLADNALEDRVALDVADIAVTQRNLLWTLAGTIILVAGVGSALGLFLARRIGRPLADLTRIATTFSADNLERPVTVPADVHEVTLVAQALERARVDLQRNIRELREAKSWADHLLEAIVEGIVTLDRLGRITFFSPGAERISGWPREAALGRSCDDVFHPAGTNIPFSRLIPPAGGQSKITLDMGDGRLATLAITGARLTPPAAGEAGVALVLRDVSEAEMIHRFLGEFLANVTHEFRTPLSALAASCELLLDQAPDLNPAELQELLIALHLGIVGLQTLVDNLLESASLEAGRFRIHPHPSDLGEMLAEATRVMQPLQARYGQRLLVELPATLPVVQADARRVVQVLVNLLSNAIKYSPDHTEIALEVTMRGKWVRVAVADRGPGIPATFRPHLFRPFAHPEPDSARSQAGAGLGLSVVRAVVEAHGGQVGTEERPGGGSIFWFTLPAASQ